LEGVVSAAADSHLMTFAGLPGALAIRIWLAIVNMS
jgi:hypothetical protein